MGFEERLEQMQKNLDGLAAVQNQMMDVLGFTIEGERRLATRVERMEESDAKLRLTLTEIGDKLNGLIGVVDGWIRRE